MAEPKSASDYPLNLQFYLRLYLGLWLLPRLRLRLLRLVGGHILHPPTVGRLDTQGRSLDCRGFCCNSAGLRD